MTGRDDLLDGCQVALDATDGYVEHPLALALLVRFAGITPDELERVAAFYQRLRGA